MSRKPDCTAGRFSSFVLLLAVLAGCNSSTSPTGGTTPVGAPSPAGQTGAASAADGLPPDLVTKVEALIRLTGEYNALAAQVTNSETWVQHRDELSRIDAELQPYVEDVSIAEPKLNAAQKLLFHSTYYDTKAFPMMQEKSAHYRRLQGLAR